MSTPLRPYQHLDASLKTLTDPNKPYRPLRSKSPGSPMRQEAMRASFQATPQQPALGRVHPPQSNPMTQSMTVPPMLNNNAMW